MKVKELMSTRLRNCRPDTDLAAAAMLMWDGDCGILPVEDPQGKICGVITDRDVCMAVGTKHRRAEEIQVKEVLNGQLFTCRPDNTVQEALEIMVEHQVRRIPVLDRSGKLKGIFSVNDAILFSENGKGRKGPNQFSQSVLTALQGICKHRDIPAPARVRKASGMRLVRQR